MILDGWGFAPPGPGNAIARARTPILDELLAKHPSTLLEASGEAVGLLPSTVGNSEIGHLVLGAGRPLLYDSLLAQRVIDTGSLRRHAGLVATCRRLAANDGALHLIGMCSDGQIHSDVGHLQELLAAAAQHQVPRVWIHAITDGRDVPDGTAGEYLARVEQFTRNAGIGRVATVTGRGYAMDKADSLHLTRAAVSVITDGDGAPVAMPQDAVASAEGDEWIPPTVLSPDEAGESGRVSDGDALLFFNFRSDRMQQLADGLLEHLAVDRQVQAWSLAQYDTRAAIPALVPRADATGGLGDQLARHRLRSVRIAENEKFDHVTYFVNGRTSRRSQFEERIRVESRAEPDYRRHPEMNVAAVADYVIAAATRDDVAVVIANLANVDVVGHTGDAVATTAAAEHVDAAVGRITAAAQAAGRWMLLVGDHGNGEVMAMHCQGEERPYGGHTTNTVPLVIVPAAGTLLLVEDLPPNRTLADVAPTVLHLLGYPPGSSMTGSSLL